jgi:starch phosphorylase
MHLQQARVLFMSAAEAAMEQARHQMALARLQHRARGRQAGGVRGLVAFGALQNARGEGAGVVGIGDPRAGIGVGERSETSELLAPALADGVGQFAVEVAEMEDRRAGVPLLAHEHQRNLRREQQRHAQRLQALRPGLVDQRRDALAERAIADLVVALQKGDEGDRRQLRARLPVRLAAQRRHLALVDETLGQRATQARQRCLGVVGVVERELDAALGNGGLGRLAAGFLDSFAEIGLPSFGYGLRYRYGMFAQRVQDGQQVEQPDDWMRDGNPWEIARPATRYAVAFGARVQGEGDLRRWLPAEHLVARAYDLVVPAHHSAHVSTLRLWQACAQGTIDFDAFRRGEQVDAGRALEEADSLNWVLYPDDSTWAGRVLRLKQKALLVSASLQDLIERHLAERGTLEGLAARNAIHLNDTHPALAPAELMRLLVDEHGMAWDAAWAVTRDAVSYTNHTLMPEALETWPLKMFGDLLPRHLEIIHQINEQFLAEVVERFPGDVDMMRRVSLIGEDGERHVRMAFLAIVASHKVNGVSALHSELMVQTIFADQAKLWPDRFHNVTNGVTPRRWLMQANPGLGTLIDGAIGAGWRTDLDRLAALRDVGGDAGFAEGLAAVKRRNTARLAEVVRQRVGIAVDVDSLFDVQAKRIHEYKRQLLNIVQVVARYQAIIDGAELQPRTVFIAGKAASAYYQAKLIIRLAHDIARMIDSDPRTSERLKLVFLPDYGVSLAEALMPAADLSQQISTAGTEASGTGNMKFALNGALTVGTWDGANIEMAKAMREDNMFVFGLRPDAVEALKAEGYEPSRYIQRDPALARAIASIASGEFSPGDPQRYRHITDELQRRNGYLLMADFGDYVQAQARVDTLFGTPARWTECVVANIAAMEEFSSDRTVREYVDRVWMPVRG